MAKTSGHLPFQFLISLPKSPDPRPGLICSSLTLRVGMRSQRTPFLSRTHPPWQQRPPVSLDDVGPHEVLFEPPAPGQPHLIPKLRLIQQSPNLLRQIKRIPRLKQQPSKPIAHGIRQPPNPAGDHSPSRRHGLNRSNAQRILSDRGHQTNIRVPIIPRQFILRAPPNRTSKLIDRPGGIKRDHQLEVTSRLAQNPASLMRDMKPLDDLTRNGRHEERGLVPRAPIPGGTGDVSAIADIRVLVESGDGSRTPPQSRLSLRESVSVFGARTPTYRQTEGLPLPPHPGGQR